MTPSYLQQRYFLQTYTGSISIALMEFDHPAAKPYLFWKHGIIIRKLDFSRVETEGRTNLRSPRILGTSTRHIGVAWVFAVLFVPNEDRLPYVTHINGNIYDHAASNLRWSAVNSDIVKRDVPVRCSSDFETLYDEDGTAYRIHCEFPTWKVYLNARMVHIRTGKERMVRDNGKPYDRIRCNVSGVTFNVSRIMTELYNPVKLLVGQLIDHVDGNKRNNDMSIVNRFGRIGNLEIVSASENIVRACIVKRELAGNKLPTGVYRHKQYGQFTVAMSFNSKLYYFGAHRNFSDAVSVRDKAFMLRDEGRFDELMQFHKPFADKQSPRRSTSHIQRIDRWTGLKDALDASCRWNEEFPGYYGKDGKVPWSSHDTRHAAVMSV
jgi:hypothetical protein